MRQAAILIIAMGCHHGGDDYTVDPPTPTPTPGVVDAPSLSVDAVLDAFEGITGRVCLLSDARDQTTCQSTGADGLTVTLDGNSATTEADGTFHILSPTGTNILWRVRGTQLVTSVMPFGATPQIPAMTIADYADLENENGAGVQAATDGEIFARVVHASAPLANAKVGSAPSASFGPFYDSTSAIAWNSGANQGTGPAGVAWFPGVAVGHVTMSVTPMGGTLLPVPNVAVESQSITWLVIDTP